MKSRPILAPLGKKRQVRQRSAPVEQTVRQLV
jgi:hypothetical protein